MEYRIDELARAAGMTVRNVRGYQDRGLLPAPRKAGRVGVYTDAHLARLRLIGQLLERGYTFGHIAELIEAWQRGRDLTQVLGLEQVLTAPWSEEITDYLTTGELAALFGPVDPELLERAVRLGVIRPDGDRFAVPSPQLLHAGAELAAAGIPLAAVLDLDEALAADIDTVARRLVDAVAAYIVPGYPADRPLDGGELDRLAALARRLRPLAQMSVQAHLARARARAVTSVLGERVAAMAAAQGPAKQAPVKQAPVKQAPVKQAPVKQAPAEQAS
jgi:DNA-binding transcriptional MerR regulator